MSDDILPVQDQTDTARNLDVELFSPGPDSTNDVLRQRVQIGGTLGDGSDIASVNSNALVVEQLVPGPQGEIGILSSAARTATNTTTHVRGAGDGIARKGQTGIMAWLNVTAQPGGGQTLSVKVQVYNGTLNTGADYCDFGVVVTAATGTFVMIMAPEMDTTHLSAGIFSKRLPPPQYIRFVITHSGAGSWTYSLDYATLPGI